jgi:hypothetical protein
VLPNRRPLDPYEAQRFVRSDPGRGLRYKPDLKVGLDIPVDANQRSGQQEPVIDAPNAKDLSEKPSNVNPQPRAQGRSMRGSGAVNRSALNWQCGEGVGVQNPNTWSNDRGGPIKGSTPCAPSSPSPPGGRLPKI